MTSKIPEASWISPRWVPALRELVLTWYVSGSWTLPDWEFLRSGPLLVSHGYPDSRESKPSVQWKSSEKLWNSKLKFSVLLFYLELKKEREREGDYITISYYGIKQTKRASTNCQLWLRNYCWYFTYIIPFILGRDIVVFSLWMVQGEAGSQKSSNSLEIIQLVNSGDWI